MNCLEKLFEAAKYPVKIRKLLQKNEINSIKLSCPSKTQSSLDAKLKGVAVTVRLNDCRDQAAAAGARAPAQ